MSPSDEKYKKSEFWPLFFHFGPIWGPGWPLNGYFFRISVSIHFKMVFNNIFNTRNTLIHISDHGIHYFLKKSVLIKANMAAFLKMHFLPFWAPVLNYWQADSFLGGKNTLKSIFKIKLTFNPTIVIFCAWLKLDL